MIYATSATSRTAIDSFPEFNDSDYQKTNTADSDNRSSLIDNRYSQISQVKNKRVADSRF